MGYYRLKWFSWSLMQAVVVPSKQTELLGCDPPHWKNSTVSPVLKPHS